MRNVIKRNGHLVMTGEETKEELTEALMNLHVYHQARDCHRLYLGTPIEGLISDMSVLVPKSSKKRNAKVTTVDMSGESL